MSKTKGYKILEKEKIEEPYFIVKITGDSNDGDYITEESKFTVDEFEKESGLLAVQILNEFYSDNHNFEEFCPEVLSVPRSDWGECHSCDDVTIEYIDISGVHYPVEIEDLTEEKIKEIKEECNGDYIGYLDDIYYSYHKKR